MVAGRSGQHLPVVLPERGSRDLHSQQVRFLGSAFTADATPDYLISTHIFILPKSANAPRTAWSEQFPIPTQEKPRVHMRRTTKSRRTALSILSKIALALFALMLMGDSAWGQATTSVRGTVVDPSGKAVAGASVVLANSESTERTTTTGEQGEYPFLFVPPGTYKLTATASGFRRYEQTDLQLLVNTPATANVQLTIGGTSETVTVTSEAPAINLVDASIGNSFNETQVSQLPLEGRNVPDLLSLQAGVAYTGNRIGDKDQDTRNGAVPP